MIQCLRPKAGPSVGVISASTVVHNYLEELDWQYGAAVVRQLTTDLPRADHEQQRESPMSVIMECNNCGARVRLSESRAQRGFSCPRCGAENHMTDEGDTETFVLEPASEADSGSLPGEIWEDVAAADLFEQAMSADGALVRACPRCGHTVHFTREQHGTAQRCPRCGFAAGSSMPALPRMLAR